MQAIFKQNLVKNLPDTYKKSVGSNNHKLFEVEQAAMTAVRADLQSVDNIIDINNATGKTLDLYGERVGQARGLASDEKYLMLIKAKIARNMCNGTYPSVIKALCTTFNCEPSEVYIEESETPCKVNAATLPLTAINSVDFTIPQTLALIKALLPVGVSLETYFFEGTFEFSDVENEYDENTGFAPFENASERDIGGILGAIGNADDVLLPI